MKPAEWGHHYEGFLAHWNKNSNPAWAFDTWFLNLFPRESEFLFNRGGYATLSFIPTLGDDDPGADRGPVVTGGLTAAGDCCLIWWLRAWSASGSGTGWKRRE